MLGRMLSDAAARAPHRTALVEGDRRLTYAELADGVASTRAQLTEAGLRPGDGIACVLPSGVAFVRLFFAAATLGARLVPLNPQLTPPELLHSMRACDARMVAGDAWRRAQLESLRAALREPAVLLTGDEL